MKKYKQLNLEERVTIKVLLQQGKSKRAIARYIVKSAVEYLLTEHILQNQQKG